jgi:DNA mismatch repair protein MutL
MSSIIKILPSHVINKIAAGEVVERPSSVVKELVENSVDAGATEILVDIEQAGRRLIRIADNGCGMSREDAELAFERHATSKITSDADLDAVRTMGFRGEALSSIASVARVKVVTATPGSKSGTLIEIEGGAVKAVSDAAAPAGTTLDINHLFYNTPARLKFLKSPATEFSHIVSAVSRQAMAYPSIRFRLTHNKKTVLDLPPSDTLKARAFQLYGSEIAENLIEFSGGRDIVRMYGLLSRPAYTRADKTYQDFYVNCRSVRNASLTHALYAAYSDMLMRDRHPLGFVFIEIDPSWVDVNIHPAKAEVRFRNQSQIHDLVRDVIRERLAGTGRASTGISHEPDSRTDGIKEAIAGYYRGADFSTPRPEHSWSPVSPVRSNAGSAPPHQAVPGSGDLELYTARTEAGGPGAEQLFPLGQVHDSFIIAQSREGMILIDQHAAHERVLFEKLQDQFGSGSVGVQTLLIPSQIELGPAQAALLSEYLPELAAVGFIVEDFGKGTFIIKSVPSLLVGGDYKQLLLDILDEVNAQGKSGKADALRDQILSVMACHPAIKVNRKLHPREMEQLIRDLSRCRMPETCPHGRPTVVRFSMEQLKKMFKRI